MDGQGNINVSAPKNIIREYSWDFHQAREGNVTIINIKKVKNSSEKSNYNHISFTFIINFL